MKLNISQDLKNINFTNCKDLTNVQVDDACNKLDNQEIIQSFTINLQNRGSSFLWRQKFSLNV